MRIPTAIKLHKASKTLELEYGADERYVLSAEFLRVHSPSAEVQGHGGEKTVVAGKSGVGLVAIEPVGNYAVRLIFDDGHDTGIYTWSYLRELGQDQERIFIRYLEALAARGLAR